MAGHVYRRLDETLGHRFDKVQPPARGFRFEPRLEIGGAVLEAKAAAHALSEVSLGRSERPGKRRLFTQSEPPHEPAGAENAIRIELLLHAPHQLKSGRWVAEDVDASLEFRRTAFDEARS